MKNYVLKKWLFCPQNEAVDWPVICVCAEYLIWTIEFWNKCDIERVFKAAIVNNGVPM